MSYVVWQLPVKQSNKTGYDWIHPKVKYHCFVNNTSLCNKYWQETLYFETGIDDEKISSSPQLVCSICYRRWEALYIQPKKERF